MMMMCSLANQEFAFRGHDSSKILSKENIAGFLNVLKNNSAFLKIIWIQPQLFNFKYRLFLYSIKFAILKFKLFKKLY